VLLLTTSLPTSVLRFHYHSLEDTLSGLQEGFARRLREYVGLFRSGAGRRGLKAAKRLLVELEREIEECEGLLDEAVEGMAPEGWGRGGVF
jgi:hypothetical protein